MQNNDTHTHKNEEFVLVVCQFVVVVHVSVIPLVFFMFSDLFSNKKCDISMTQTSQLTTTG